MGLAARCSWLKQFTLATVLLFSGIGTLSGAATAQQESQLIDEQNPIVAFYPKEQIQKTTEEDVAYLRQQALADNKSLAGPATFQDLGESTAADDGDGHGYRVKVPESFVLDSWTTIDEMVTDKDPVSGSYFDDKDTAGGVFGAKVAELAFNGKYERGILCLDSEATPELGGGVTCGIDNTTGIIIISKYEDLETVPRFERTLSDSDGNITSDDLIQYHFDLMKVSNKLWGYQYTITNTTDMHVNVTNAATNQTIGGASAKLVEFSEGNSLSEQTGSTPKSQQILFAVFNDKQTGEVTGFDIEFKEGKANASTTKAGPLITIVPAISEVFNSFEVVKNETALPLRSFENEASIPDSSDEEQSVAPTPPSTAPSPPEEDEEQSDCDNSYPDFCIPSPPPDLDCSDIDEKDFTVRDPDPHKFDGDNDGKGCES